MVLWAVNIASTFLIAHYLFEMNTRSLFFGWNGQSMLAFLDEPHRFSSTLLGLGSDPIIGLGNSSYSLNPSWFPSFALSRASFRRNQCAARLRYRSY